MTAPDASGYRRTTVDVLEACQRLAEQGRAITHLSVAAEAGLSGSAVAHYHLDKLRRDGWLKTAVNGQGQLKVLGVSYSRDDLTAHQSALVLAERIAGLDLARKTALWNLLGEDAVRDFVDAHPPRSTRHDDDAAIAGRASILAHAALVKRRRHHATFDPDPES